MISLKSLSNPCRTGGSRCICAWVLSNTSATASPYTSGFLKLWNLKRINGLQNGWFLVCGVQSLPTEENINRTNHFVAVTDGNLTTSLRSGDVTLKEIHLASAQRT